MSTYGWGFQTAGQAQLHDDLYGTEYASGPRVIQDWDAESQWAVPPGEPAPPPEPTCTPVRFREVNCAECDTTGFVTCPPCCGRLFNEGFGPRCETCHGTGRLGCSHCAGHGHLYALETR